MPRAAAGLEWRQRAVGKMPKNNSTVQQRPMRRPQPGEDQILASNLTLHELFQRQTAAMLERADPSDEERQSILIAMSCPVLRGGRVFVYGEVEARGVRPLPLFNAPRLENITGT